MFVVLSRVVVFEQWLDATAGQLLVNTPSYLTDQLSYLLVNLHVFFACWSVYTANRIFTLEINPNLFKPSFFVFLSFPKLVLGFK